MILEKKQIQQLIADGQLKPAVQAAIDYAEACKSTEMLNALTNISGQIDVNQQNWTLNLIPYDDFTRALARLTVGITDCLDQLPPTPSVVQTQKLIDETVFKRRLFSLLIGSKALVFVYVFYLWSHGGFQKEEAMTSFSSLAPAFVAYLTLMLSDFIRTSRDNTPNKRRYVSGFLVNMVWWLFPLYAFAQMYVVTQKVEGNFTFLQMISAIAITESLIGTYIGKIIEEFFKKDK